MTSANALAFSAQNPGGQCTYAEYSKAEYFLENNTVEAKYFFPIHRRLNTARARLGLVEFEYSTCKTSPRISIQQAQDQPPHPPNLLAASRLGCALRASHRGKLASLAFSYSCLNYIFTTTIPYTKSQNYGDICIFCTRSVGMGVLGVWGVCW